MARLYEWLIEDGKARGFVVGDKTFLDCTYIQTSKVCNIIDNGEYFQIETAQNSYIAYKKDCNKIWISIKTCSGAFDGIPNESIKSLQQLAQAEIEDRHAIIRNSVARGWVYLAIIGSIPIQALYKSPRGLDYRLKIELTDQLLENDNTIRAVIQHKYVADTKIIYTSCTDRISNIKIFGADGLLIDNRGDLDTVISGEANVMSLARSQIKVYLE